jgi:hypothetical protein
MIRQKPYLSSVLETTREISVWYPGISYSVVNFVTWTSLPGTGTLIFHPFDTGEGWICLYLILRFIWCLDFVLICTFLFVLFSNNKLVNILTHQCAIYVSSTACHNSVYPSHVFSYSLLVSLKHKIYYVQFCLNFDVLFNNTWVFVLLRLICFL